MRRLLFVLLLLLTAACSSALSNRSKAVGFYAAKASWQWQNLHSFSVRGRVRLQDASRVFSGPFFVLASKDSALVRADFCGPDGSPFLSLRLDSSGCLIYQPGEDRAFFVEGGLPVGDAVLDVDAAVSLIRTGYPDIPVQWKIVELADTTGEEGVLWLFRSDAADTATVVLETDNLFPAFSAEDFTLRVSSTSWHDGFNAWPMEWYFDSPSVSAVIRVRSYDTTPELSERIRNLVVPVPVDTVSAQGGFLRPATELPIR